MSQMAVTSFLPNPLLLSGGGDSNGPLPGKLDVHPFCLRRSYSAAVANAFSSSVSSYAPSPAENDPEELPREQAQAVLHQIRYLRLHPPDRRLHVPAERVPGHRPVEQGAGYVLRHGEHMGCLLAGLIYGIVLLTELLYSRLVILRDSSR